MCLSSLDFLVTGGCRPGHTFGSTYRFHSCMGLGLERTEVLGTVGGRDRFSGRDDDYYDLGSQFVLALGPRVTTSL